jgi:hypothetical protein
VNSPDSIHYHNELVFWKPDNHEHGLFLTQEHFRVLQNFSYARENSLTWGDFWQKCSSETKDFCSLFLENDEKTPDNDEFLLNLDDDVFILGDREFPLTQCAEETCTHLGPKFLDKFIVGAVMTEYGERINLYDASNLEGLFKQAEKLGFFIRKNSDEFPFIIASY